MNKAPRHFGLPRRLHAPLLALLVATGCAGPTAPVAAAERATAEKASPRWHAVLVAGDPSLEVWDRAVERMGARLLAGGRVATMRSFSARRDRVAAGAEPALRADVLGAIAGLRPAAGEACLVFLTMHGAPQRGLALAAENSFISPANLDAALSQGCGQAPTFVIASGCFTGNFAQGAMARPNRVVLTAARADRSSFGCSPQFELTVYDRCLLDGLDAGQPSAAALAKASQVCVAVEERRQRMSPPSEPQSAIGAAVRGLVPRWAGALTPQPAEQ